MLGYGVVGCGYVCERHIRAIKKLKGAKLIALCDTRKQRAKEAASKYKVERYFTDYRQLISLKEIDVVVILVPDYLHREITARAARAGKHICLEKPIARTLQEARKIMSVCKKNKVKLCVAHPMRFFPAWQRAKQLIKAGYLGNVFKLKAKNCGYCNFSESKIEWGWRFNPQLGSGIMGDVGVHYVDSFRYLLAKDPVSVYAEMERVRKREIKIADNALLLLRFPGDVIAEIDLSLSQREISEGEKIEVYGREGSLAFNTFGREMKVYSTKMRGSGGAAITEKLPSADFSLIWGGLHRQFLV